jgi:hypothetical protein
LLFRPRKHTELVQPKQKEPNEEYLIYIGYHIDLCETVLNTIHKFVLQNAPNLSDETWEIILKVSLAICDTLLISQQSKHLTQKPNTNEIDAEEIVRLMGDKLSRILIRVFQIN